MPTEIPAELTPNTLLVASLVLVVLILFVFLRKSLQADRLVAAAERRAEAEADRARGLETELQRRAAAAGADDVVALLEELPPALNVSDEAKTRRQVCEALGAGLKRVLAPKQWMVFLDVEGDGKQYALVAAGAVQSGTWPVGACLSPQMGRVGLAIRRKQAMDKADFLAEPPIVRDQLNETEPKAFHVDAVAPIFVDGRVVGALTVGGSKMPPNVIRAVLGVFAGQAALLHRLATARQRALQLENLDDATGLHNRNWFTAQGSELLFRTREQLTPIACAVVGIDDFRIYVGREGPTAAQQLQRRVARILKTNVRGGDLLCRWSEDEFAVLMPNVDRGAAHELMDRVRRRIASEPFVGAEQQPEGVVTASVGIAVAPQDGRAFDVLVDHAYRAYLTSARRGGDRTSGEVEIDDEFIDVVSGLADVTPLRAPGTDGRDPDVR